MPTLGLLRVQNESRWIACVLHSIEPVCSDILVFDDHSTDNTADIVRSLGHTVLPSPFPNDKLPNEVRDKNYLLDHVKSLVSSRNYANVSCLMIDGDEELHPSDIATVKQLTEPIPVTIDHRACRQCDGSGWVQSYVGTPVACTYFETGSGNLNLHRPMCYALQVLYLWDSPNQIRVDGGYRDFRRPSLFRLTPSCTFRPTQFGGNFHCSNAPSPQVTASHKENVRLLHYGYMDREDRVKKYEWYNQIDPNNEAEDCYRHMVIGDLFPPSSKFKHGGPLELVRFDY